MKHLSQLDQKGCFNRLASQSQIDLANVRFDADKVPTARMSDLARIYYSMAMAKSQPVQKKNGPEALSDILLRTMVEITKAHQQRVN